MRHYIAVFSVVTKSSRECPHSFLRNVMEIIVSISYSFANPIGVAVRLLEKGVLMLNIYRDCHLHGKCLCDNVSFFPFLSGVEVDTIKLQYFRNLYFSLKLFEVRDRGFDSLWAHWDFSLT